MTSKAERSKAGCNTPTQQRLRAFVAEKVMKAPGMILKSGSWFVFHTGFLTTGLYFGFSKLAFLVKALNDTTNFP